VNDLDPTIVIGDTLDPSGSDCGCCASPAANGLQLVWNRPGLPAIGYRVGTHASFVSAMRARLSSTDYTALAGLQTRDNDDLSIALIDATATVADVLTFYQERIANESYLRTATELLSVTEVSRLIGYRPRPGVAASSYLAFQLEPAAGAPDRAVDETQIDIGTQVQSIPGPGQKPQTFETVESITARLEWSAMKPLQRKLLVPGFGSTFTYLDGTATQLKVGDAILLAGDEQVEHPPYEFWDMRILTAVSADSTTNQTRIEWTPGLGSTEPHSEPSKNPRVYALRLRTGLFGQNAPSPLTLHYSIRNHYPAGAFSDTDWTFTIGNQTLNLDNSYPSIVTGSWLVLSKPDYRELYRVDKVSEGALARYGITGKSTQVHLNIDENLDLFDGADYRSATVFAQSEELPYGEAPVPEPVVRGDTIVLDRLVTDLAVGRTLIVRGKRTRFKVVGKKLNLVSAAGQLIRALDPDELLTVLSAPKQAPWGTAVGLWQVRDVHGVEGTVTAAAQNFSFVPAAKDDEIVAELAELKAAEREDGRYSRLVLSLPLANVYDLVSAEVLGNVAPATHGETTGEILGNGNAASVFQSFILKQTPLTYTAADNATGTASTLQVRVGEVLWHEVPTFYGLGPKERVFITRASSDNKVTVEFGDGKSGARLPSGQNNIRATYRKGIGLGGLVDTGQLSMLMSRPLGVKSVVNPLPATGAADPDAIDTARDNAPLGVLTLGRTVSLRDYEDFARGFAGIDKALATWVWDGRTRRIFITVAGTDGAEISPDDVLYQRLVAALARAGDPFVTFDVRSYRPVNFRVALKVKVNPDYLAAKTLADVELALRVRFAFKARQFGQPVALSEVIAVAQNTPGVDAIDLDRLYRAIPPLNAPALNVRLPAALPEIGADGVVVGAELLTLDPAPLEKLEVMP
jgi:hypothetical protein